MTEVVTTYAASPQLNLLAQRQQGFGVSTPSMQAEAPTADINALQSVLAAADKSENNSFAAELPARDASANNNGSGPSRPRVEIKQFDVGLSPSEVVGTQDVLQRFDANGDGRVDTLEADKAALVRQKVFTFAGLAAAPAPVSGEQSRVDLTEAEAPALARETGLAIAALAGESEPGVPKKFSASLVQDPTAKKYFAEAAEGAPSGTADAPKKYYGQGAEVVVAGQANNGANPPVKYADRAPVREQTVSEDGTGEVKYYDRVPQAEAGDTGGDPAAREKYSEKAQEIAAAYAALNGDAAPQAPVAATVTA
ncbi:MAG: hypothetical protein AB7E79_01175 [Rhodospirillaceae bacterium]